MRIHVWGINYSPEVTGIAPCNTALCDFLLERGHTVEMVTTFFYYPAWKKLPTEDKILYRTDDLDGVKVHRCWHYVPAKATVLRRMVHELSFVATSFFRQLRLPRPNLLIVVSPPLLLGFAAWFLTRFKRAPFIFHVQDLQPAAAAGLGLVKSSSVLMKLLLWAEGFAYRKAAMVSGISQSMLEHFIERGVKKESTLYFPNGIMVPAKARIPTKGQFRSRNGIGPDRFVITYSGNIGVKQGLDLVVRAAAKVANPRVLIIFCGEGAALTNLQNLASELQVRNLHFLPLQAEPRYREMLVDSDLCLIPQQPGTGKYFFPSKLLPPLAFARPVLTTADEASELAKLVRDGGFGINIAGAGPESLAKTFEQLSTQPPLLEQWAEAGGKYVERFNQPAILERVSADLEKRFGD